MSKDSLEISATGFGCSRAISYYRSIADLLEKILLIAVNVNVLLRQLYSLLQSLVNLDV